MKNPGEIAHRIVQTISQVVIGKEQQVRLVVAALLARGHVLIEDIPGVGKTLLALATARAIGVRFRRIQCTSDTLPSDILGVNVFNQKTTEFEFREGPIFTEVLLADEINRTSPRTQSALLEAMAEGYVSVDGSSYPLPQPFLVLATMNPVERYGSFELPESQLDRFTLSISLGYPAREHEKKIFAQDREHAQAKDLTPVADQDLILELQHLVRQVTVSDPMLEYMLDVVHATRENSAIRLGLSSRGGLHLKRAMQAVALMDGRNYVIPSDLRAVFLPVTQHRLLLSGIPNGRHRERREEILKSILELTPAPV